MIDKYSIEEKIDILANAVADLLEAATHNTLVDRKNGELVVKLETAFKNLQKEVTYITNAYSIVQDDLTAIAARLNTLEKVQLAELGDRK